MKQLFVFKKYTVLFFNIGIKNTRDRLFWGEWFMQNNFFLLYSFGLNGYQIVTYATDHICREIYESSEYNLILKILHRFNL